MPMENDFTAAADKLIAAEKHKEVCKELLTNILVGMFLDEEKFRRMIIRNAPDQGLSLAWEQYTVAEHLHTQASRELLGEA